jgi:hypothetical protein
MEQPLTLDEVLDRLKRSQQSPVTPSAPTAPSSPTMGQPETGPPPAPSVLPVLPPGGQPAPEPAPAPTALEQPQSQPMGMAQQPVTQPPSEPGWKAYPINPGALGKLPEGQRLDLKGGMPQFRTDDNNEFLVDPQGHWIPKTITEGEQKLGDTKSEQDLGLAPVKQIIADARNMTGLPEFDKALKLSKVSPKVNVPYGGGTVDLSGPVRALSPEQSSQQAFSTMDDVSAVQQRLTLLITRASAKNQGTISDYERSIFAEAVGQLGYANSKADFQFRLNSVERMADTLMAGKKLDKNTDYTTKPTVKEMAGLTKEMYAAKTPEQISAKVAALAKKYNVSEEDMSEYVLREMGVFKDKPGMLDWLFGSRKSADGTGDNSPETLEAAKRELSKGSR